MRFSLCVYLSSHMLNCNKHRHPKRKNHNECASYIQCFFCCCFVFISGGYCGVSVTELWNRQLTLNTRTRLICFTSNYTLRRAVCVVTVAWLPIIWHRLAVACSSCYEVKRHVCVCVWRGGVLQGDVIAAPYCHSLHVSSPEEALVG